MIITIDIGNTNTGIAAGDGGKILKTDSVKTGFRGCYEKRLAKALRALLKDIGHTAQDTRESMEILICSVVPKALPIAKRCAKKVFKVSAAVVGRDIVVPIKNRYGDPKQVGQDRLLCAFAAAELYGCPAVVVDLGTAITFDVVSSNREYLGGIIAPGIRLSAETLFQQTALLPRVMIHKPKQLIGKSTEESILSGMFYGYGEMIKGVVDLLVKQLKSKPVIVVTGGYSDLMEKYIPSYKCVVDKELIFKGMNLLIAHS